MTHPRYCHVTYLYDYVHCASHRQHGFMDRGINLVIVVDLMNTVYYIAHAI